jgi:hypothetical protein
MMKHLVAMLVGLFAASAVPVLAQQAAVGSAHSEPLVARTGVAALGAQAGTAGPGAQAGTAPAAPDFYASDPSLREYVLDALGRNPSIQEGLTPYHAALERVPAAERAGVGINIVAPEAPGTRFPIDPRQIEQVLFNLTLNAIQASPPGGRVTITRRRTAGGAIAPATAAADAAIRPAVWRPLAAGSPAHDDSRTTSRSDSRRSRARTGERGR